MTRSLGALAILSSLGGCIIYETDGRDDRGVCVGRCDDDGGDTTGTGDTGTDTGTTGTVTEEPPEIALSLAPSEGVAGDAMLVWLQASDPTFDFANVEGVTFVGDVWVDDLIVRPDEVIMLIEIDAGAAPGRVEAIVELTDGAVLVDGGFTVIEATNGGGGSGGGGSCPAGTGDTGMGDC